jgi:hypothetical protein
VHHLYKVSQQDHVNVRATDSDPKVTVHQLDHEFACTQSRETAIRVRETAARFLDGYVAFNRISQDAAIASYVATVKRYVKDIHAYVKTCVSTNGDQCEKLFLCLPEAGLEYSKLHPS